MLISVYGEIQKGNLSRETEEVLTQAVQLKQETGDDVELLLIVGRDFPFQSLMDRWGIDSIFAFQKESAGYCPEETLLHLQDYSIRREPRLFLFAGSVRGAELAPRLAFRNEMSAILDCTKLAYDQKENALRATKPVYGGNVFCEYLLEFPCMVALRPHQVSVQEISPRRVPVQVERVKPFQSPESIGNRRLVSQSGQGLEEKKLVFICGRGIGGKENVERLIRLADRFDAGVGGTKKAVENGWLPISQMVGQTGRILTPDLCVVWGASGATPFLNGIEGANRIIAINEDETARIFEAADLGMTTDCIGLLIGMEQALEEV